MTRSLMAGMTDYSHQSFEDMMTDLYDWVQNLAQVCEILENSEAELKANSYWNNASYGVRGRFGYSLRFFKTSIEEIDSILADFTDEIQVNHITRIRSLAQTAEKIHSDLGIAWNEDSWDMKKDYGNPSFSVLERMYIEARGMAADLIDLSNLSARLEDFIGKKGKENSKAAKIRKPTVPLDLFVDQTRLDELQSIKSSNFDLTKLIRLCEELNTCYINNSYLTTAMAGRAILDHVPPIFQCNSFAEVANNYPDGSKSFKQSMTNLELSLRKIADAHLHTRIRSKETLPNKTQVNFSNDLDVLLAEIVRLLK